MVQRAGAYVPRGRFNLLTTEVPDFLYHGIQHLQEYSVDRYLISHNHMYTLFDQVEVQDSEMNQQGRQAKDGGTVTPYTTASWASRGTWAWMSPLVQRGSYMQISDVPTLSPSDGPECHVSFSLFHSPLPFRLCLKIDFSVNLKIRWLGPCSY